MTSKKAVTTPKATASPPLAQWDVVVVPFPFSNQPGAKRRPALVLSVSSFNRRGHTVLAMITSATHHPWPGDVHISDLKAAGLTKPCLVRLKLFTLDQRLIIKKLGHLAAADRQPVSQQLQTYLPW